MLLVVVGPEGRVVGVRHHPAIAGVVQQQRAPVLGILLVRVAAGDLTLMHPVLSPMPPISTVAVSAVLVPVVLSAVPVTAEIPGVGTCYIACSRSGSGGSLSRCTRSDS